MFSRVVVNIYFSRRVISFFFYCSGDGVDGEFGYKRIVVFR